MTIKTITLTGEETKVEYSSGANAWLRNDGTDMIYASASAGISAGADGVISIKAGDKVALFGANGTVYLLGTGSVQLVGSDYAECPFKVSAQSGGSGADEVARAAIEAHAKDAEIHVTSTEKSNWDAKADKSDIQTSLPANGGNADTVDGKHADDFLKQHTISGVDLGFSVGQNVSVSDFINAVADKFGDASPMFASVAWSDARCCNIVCGDGSTVAFNGGFIYGAAIHTTYSWSHTRLIYFPGNFTETALNGYIIRSQIGDLDGNIQIAINAINDGGKAASVGDYTEAKIAALEARIAALEGK